MESERLPSPTTLSTRSLTTAIYLPFLPEENAQHEDRSFLFMQTRSTLHMAPFVIAFAI